MKTDDFINQIREVSLRNIKNAEIILEYLSRVVVEKLEKPIEGDFAFNNGVSVNASEITKATGVIITPAVVKLLEETGNVYKMNMHYTQASPKCEAYFTVYTPHLDTVLDRADLKVSPVILCKRDSLF